MRKFFKKYLPDHQTITQNRWLAPFANTLLHPRLWHLNRHSAAGAVAIGLFCGLVPGPLQMISAAVCCVLFRVNLPLALFTTLYTNPFTIIPLYIVAYSMGQFVLGHGLVVDIPLPPAYDLRNPAAWIHELSAWTYALGKPLVIGLILLATLLAISGYFAVKTAWRWHLIRAWHRRKSSKNRSK